MNKKTNVEIYPEMRGIIIIIRDTYEYY